MKRWPRWLALATEAVASIGIAALATMAVALPALAAASTGTVSCSTADHSWHEAAVPLIPLSGQPTKAQLAEAQPLQPGGYIALGPDASGRNLLMCYAPNPAFNTFTGNSRYPVHRLSSGAAAPKPVPIGSYLAVSAGTTAGKSAVLFRAPDLTKQCPASEIGKFGLITLATLPASKGPSAAPRPPVLLSRGWYLVVGSTNTSLLLCWVKFANGVSAPRPTTQRLVQWWDGAALITAANVGVLASKVPGGRYTIKSTGKGLGTSANLAYTSAADSNNGFALLIGFLALACVVGLLGRKVLSP